MMKKLPSQFEAENQKFSQVKRSDKAALYKRENPDGSLVSYEVFAVRTKNGSEVYPNKTAFGKGEFTWAWCPIELAKAEQLYAMADKAGTADGFVPMWDNIDPETGERVELSEEQESVITEAFPVPVEGEKMVATVSVENVNLTDTTTETETPAEDIVEPTEIMPTGEPQSTPDGGAVVPVLEVGKKEVKKTEKKAKGKTPKKDSKEKTVKTEVKYKFPKGEFTQADFARANGLPERGVVWSKLDKLVQGKVLSKKLKKLGRGRPSQIFTLLEKKK